MHFTFWAIIAATALVLAWWFTRNQARPQAPVTRLSITVSEGVALVKLPVAYEMEDLAVLWDFLQGQEAAVTRTQVHSLLYDCSDWVWSNVLGLEMMSWQAEATWTGNTLFCQLSPEVKSVLTSLLPEENGPQQTGGALPIFRPALYFATVEEGLTYSRGPQT